jgi:hypothetical protein
MVPLHSAGDVGLGASLAVSNDLDPSLLKPKGMVVFAGDRLLTILIYLS